MSDVRLYPLNKIAALSDDSDKAILVVTEGTGSSEDAAEISAAIGISSSTGGNGAADAGKLLRFNSVGGVTLGSSSSANPVQIIGNSGYVFQATAVGVGVFAMEAGLTDNQQVGYSCHLVFDQQTGVAIDGNGGTNSTGFQCNVNGVGLKVQDGDANDTLSIHGDGRIQGWEMASAPSAPAANSYILYCEDNGSGKTRLMVRFATGAAVQLAIQP